MARITEQEVLHLGYLARIRIEPDELAAITRQIDGVLECAASLAEVAKTISTEISQVPQRNIMRDDVIERFDSQSILDEAPKQQNNLFVVPHILGQGE